MCGVGALARQELNLLGRRPEKTEQENLKPDAKNPSGGLL